MPSAVFTEASRPSTMALRIELTPHAETHHAMAQAGPIVAGLSVWGALVSPSTGAANAREQNLALLRRRAGERNRVAGNGRRGPAHCRPIRNCDIPSRDRAMYRACRACGRWATQSSLSFWTKICIVGAAL